MSTWNPTHRRRKFNIYFSENCDTLPHLNSECRIFARSLPKQTLLYATSHFTSLLQYLFVANPQFYSGKTLSIKATGNFTQEIEEGAYAVLSVKFGAIRLIHRREDLCQQMKNIDKECPLEKGETTITRDIDLPQQIPPVSFPPLLLLTGCGADHGFREPLALRATFTPRMIRRSPVCRLL